MLGDNLVYCALSYWNEATAEIRGYRHGTVCGVTIKGLELQTNSGGSGVMEVLGQV